MLIDESYNANPAIDGGDAEEPRRESATSRGASPCSGRCANLASMPTTCTPAWPSRCCEAKVDQLILVGDDMAPLAEGAGRTRLQVDRVANVDEATELLQSLLRAGDVVLVKASNSIGLAKLVEQRWRGDRQMLYLIAEQLGFPGLLNLIRYISFRAGAASATALLIGLLLGPAFIRWLRAKQGKGQPIRADGPQSHLAKRGTPTMGGLLILISVGDFGAAVDGPQQPLRLGVPAGHRRLRADRVPRRL